MKGRDDHRYARQDAGYSAVEIGVVLLPLDAARPDHYVFDGRPRPLQRVDVAVDVKKDDGTMADERRAYWRSHLGPIVYRNATAAFAYRSTAADAWKWFEGFWRLSHARSPRDYMKIMSTRFSPESNYTYADADGNILYLWNSRIPKRVQDGTSYDLDVPGATKKYVRKELHPTRDSAAVAEPAWRVHPERQQPALVRDVAAAARSGAVSRLLVL